MGCTATIAGYSTATMGILAVFLAPLIAEMSSKFDPRPFVFVGVIWFVIWVAPKPKHSVDPGAAH